jgi:hypothetical protein
LQPLTVRTPAEVTFIGIFQTLFVRVTLCEARFKCVFASFWAWLEWGLGRSGRPRRANSTAFGAGTLASRGVRTVHADFWAARAALVIYVSSLHQFRRVRAARRCLPKTSANRAWPFDRGAKIIGAKRWSSC